MEHTQRPLTARQAFARGYRARDTYQYSGTPQAPAPRVVGGWPGVRVGGRATGSGRLKSVREVRDDNTRARRDRRCGGCGLRDFYLAMWWPI